MRKQRGNAEERVGKGKVKEMVIKFGGTRNERVEGGGLGKKKNERKRENERMNE